jgi:uncharacterized membrane protein YbhN (UPF0104 family)
LLRLSTVLRGARVALGVGLLALLCTRVRPQELATLAREGDGGQLALALGLLFAANPLIQTLRLHVLVVRYTKSLAVTFEVFSVGAFFNLMLPSNVGGDAVKLLYLKRLRAENWGGPFALLMLHRFTGMMVLLVGAAVYAVVSHARIAVLLADARVQAHVPVSALALAGGAALVGLLGWLALSPRYRERIGGPVRRFAAECGRALVEVGARATAELLLLTVAFHFIRMVAFYLLVAATGQHIGLLDLLIVLAATAVAGVVPLSVGGLGLMEGAVSLTLGLFGVAPSAALVAALANRAILLAGAGIGGVLYVTSRGDRAARES